MMKTAEALVGAAFGLAGVGVLTLIRAVPRPRPEPDEPAPADIGTSPYYPCHTTACGHLSTPHVRTPDGLVCRRCGTTKEGAL